MTRAAVAQGKSERRVVVLVFHGVVGVLIALVGIGIGWEANEGRNPYGVLFGVLMASMGLLCAVRAALEVWHQVHRRGAAVGSDPWGRPATTIAVAPWFMPLCVVTLVLVSGPAFAAAVFAFGEGNAVVGVLLVLLGLWPASGFPALLRRKVHGGGLYLAPEDLTYWKWASTWRVQWDDIAGVVPDEPLAVVLRDGARVERGRTTRWGWKGEVKAPAGVLGVQTRYLAEGPGVLSFLLLAYKDRPDLRPQLGTPASLEWEILRGRR